MSVLTIIQSACRRLALPVPNAALTSTDQQVIQMVGLCNEEGEELAERYPWSALQTEATHTTLAAELQGVMTTIAPGFKYIINDTIWNRTRTLPVFGPLTPQGWQQRKSSNVTGPYSEFRLRGGSLYFIPAPTAGQTVAFEYMSRNWVTTGASTASAWVLDADTSVLDEQLILLGLIWRFKQYKGFDYDEDFRKYERRVTDAMGRDGGKPSLDAGGGVARPGLLVPEGSWSIS